MRFFVLPIFDGVIMDGHPIFQSWWIPATPASTTQNIGCPSIMTPSKMGKTKNLIFYSLIKSSKRFLLFFSILRHTKGNQAMGQNRARMGAYRVVQALSRGFA